MRLFIAVNFNTEVRARITETINGLRLQAVRGSFTRSENLHLTLVFIGETRRREDVIRAMESVSSPAFELSLEGFGRFRREGGDVCWIGVVQNPRLGELHRLLRDGLIQNRFDIDMREFRPHLTLGRRVVLPGDFDREGFAGHIPPITVPVDRISLMSSQRINGVLTYREVYSKKLGEDVE